MLMTPRMFTVVIALMSIAAAGLAAIGWRIWDFEVARYESALKAEWNSNYQNGILIQLTDKLDKAFVAIGDSNKLVVEGMNKLQAEIDAHDRRIHDLEMKK
jgi:hypothetical protein